MPFLLVYLPTLPSSSHSDHLNVGSRNMITFASDKCFGQYNDTGQWELEGNRTVDEEGHASSRVIPTGLPSVPSV
jgi:hypothetical protein